VEQSFKVLKKSKISKCSALGQVLVLKYSRSHYACWYMLPAPTANVQFSKERSESKDSFWINQAEREGSNHEYAMISGLKINFGAWSPIGPICLNS